MHLREADIKPAMDLMSMSDEAAMQAAGVDPDEVSDYDRNIRIRAIDVLNTPKFSRVWQVGGIGEVFVFIECFFNRYAIN